VLIERHAQQFDADIKGLIAIGEDISKRKENRNRLCKMPK